MSSLKDAINAINSAMVDIQKDSIAELHLKIESLQLEVETLKQEVILQKNYKMRAIKITKDLINKVEQVLCE
jgi:hypothetical protein